MILAISRLEAPSARRARMSRSRDTEGSPASILATLDWAECVRRPFGARESPKGRAVFGRLSTAFHKYGYDSVRPEEASKAVSKGVAVVDSPE
jgi:hypothetical protein